MSPDLFFENKKFITSKQASKLTGYSKDYIGQLSRSQKIESRRIGHTWYVCEESLLNYKNSPTDYDFSKNFLGKELLSSEKAEVLSLPENATKEEVSQVINDDISSFVKSVSLGKSHTSIFEKHNNHTSLSEVQKVRKTVDNKSPYFGEISKYIFHRGVPVFVSLVLFLAFVLSGANFSNIRSSMLASVATTTGDLNLVDESGVVVYHEVNDWFYFNIYEPVAELLNRRIIEVNNVYIAKNLPAVSTTTNRIILAQGNPAPVAPRVVNTTNVVERIYEREVPSDFSKDYLELRLQELNNKIQSQLSQLSTGSGGNVTNIYREIAQSQRIDQLSGTQINNPIITGGSITNTSINASSLNATSLSVSGSVTLGTTTVTNLIVTNTSTSTFSGGISVTGGCVSVNGTCLGTGSSGGVSTGGTFSTTTSTVAGILVNYSNNSTDILAIGGNSTSSSKFFYDPNSLTGYLAGSLGIGTTSPYTSLGVAGTVVANNFLATSTTATSTFSGGVSINSLAVTGTISSSTFANGINLTTGCFAVNGVCLGNSSPLTFTYPLTNSSNVISLAFGTTTANSWSALQTFAYSSSTAYSSFTTASTTNLFAGTLSLPNITQGFAYFGTNGIVNSVASSSIRLSWFNNDSNFLSSYDAFTHPLAGQSATTSLVLFYGQASSTQLSANVAYFGGTATTTISQNGNLTTQQATTTNLAITNILSTLLKTNAQGSVIPAIAGTDYLASTFAFPFTTNANYNSTSTVIGFSGGLFSTASSTFNSSLFLSNLTQGYSFIGSNGLVQTVSTSTLAGQVFPFTNNVGYNSTSTTLGLLNGFFSTASSTISGTFNLPTLTTGGLAVNPAGQVYSYSTSTWTFASSTLLSDTNFWSGVNRFAFSSTTYGSFTTASTTNLFAGTLNLASNLNGPLQVNAGLVSATSSIGVLYGGTGLTSAPTYGQLLVGDNSGGYTLTATSSLGLPTFSALFGGNNTWTGLQTFTNTSTTLASFSYASSTNLFAGTASITSLSLPSLSSGFVGVGSNGNIYSFATSTIRTSGLTNDAGFTNYAFPFTTNTNYNSTTSVIGFSGGLFSTASSTFNNNLFLSNLSQGFLYTGTNGLTQTIASSSIRLSWFNNDANFFSSYDAFTHPANNVSATSSIFQFGTTTLTYLAQTFIGSSTAPQLALGDNTSGDPLWAFRNAGGNLYLA
ncbi:MAG: helix-turn-helix domain-containing protein, partial [Minisyncoccia bacterium]